MPLALRGKTQGISLLFPMEKLFERYVETQLRRQLPVPYTLKIQASGKSLCDHDGRSIFQLRPDFLIKNGRKTVIVLDTKWKLISTTDRENKYGLSQSDFYQLFAYGHKHLGGDGEMLLIYPRTDNFKDVLPQFDFSPDLKLWVVPFDLTNDKMYWPAGWEETVFTKMRITG